MPDYETGRTLLIIEEVMDNITALIVAILITDGFEHVEKPLWFKRVER